jgi:hypothetical protein
MELREALEIVFGRGRGNLGEAFDLAEKAARAELARREGEPKRASLLQLMQHFAQEAADWRSNAKPHFAKMDDEVCEILKALIGLKEAMHLPRSCTLSCAQEDRIRACLLDNLLASLP